jgi:hypothetical protein
MDCKELDPMKHFTAALYFLFLAAACAAQNADSSQYAILVHVSATQVDSGGSYLIQTLTVTIGGKHYLLWGNLISGSLLDPGDYRAKLIADVHKTNYLTSQEYEFLLPDGKTWKCNLAGESE